MAVAVATHERGVSAARRCVVVLLAALAAGMVAPLVGVARAGAAPVAPVQAVPVDTATLVRMTATSGWSPGSPDPAGVAWMPGADRLVVVDSEVDETTGAGWNNVNIWFAQRNGTQTGTGTAWGNNAALFNGNRGYSREPTGASFDPTGNVLFISDDSARKVFVIRAGPDTVFGNTDDVVTAIDTAAIGSTDTEDPVYDPVSGALFFLDGVGTEVYRVTPVDGVFGNGNDTVTHFDISHLGPTDFEGLARDPARGTLYVGARSTRQIFEIGPTGTHLRTINATGITGLRFISGLEVAPSSTGSGQSNLFIVDRAIDNGADAKENDGRLYEIAAPNVGSTTPVGNVAPTVYAGADQTVVLPPGTAALNGTVSDDGNPAGGTVTTAWSKVSGPGTVTYADSQATSTTATFSATGTYTLRLTASDGALTATDDLTVTVNPPPRAIDVASITSTGSRTKAGVSATASVTVRDANTATVSGVSVTGTWYRDAQAISTKSGTTSRTGVASIKSGTLKVPSGTVLRFCVTALTGSNMTWNTTLFQPATATDCTTWTAP